MNNYWLVITHLHNASVIPVTPKQPLLYYGQHNIIIYWTWIILEARLICLLILSFAVIQLTWGESNYTNTFNRTNTHANSDARAHKHPHACSLNELPPVITPLGISRVRKHWISGIVGTVERGANWTKMQKRNFGKWEVALHFLKTILCCS